MEIDGKRFDSKKESRRYLALQGMLAQGQISDLKTQVRYNIVVNDQRVCAYVADFVYQRAGSTVVEDVKSDFTRKNPVYRLKKKLLKASLGIDIVEI